MGSMGLRENVNMKDEKQLKVYLDNLANEYRNGCYNEKNPALCHLLGDYFESIQQDLKKAEKVYQVNCDEHNYGHSCFKYGNYIFLGRNKPQKVDHVKALVYFDKGCKLKYPKSCLHSGLMRTSLYSEIPNDPKTAFAFFDTGCSMDNAESCYYVSGMFLAGVDQAVDKNMDKAFQYSMKACNLGHKLACTNLSVMYRKGEGVARDDKKSIEYELKARKMKDQVVEQFRNIAFEQKVQQN